MCTKECNLRCRYCFEEENFKSIILPSRDRINQSFRAAMPMLKDFCRQLIEYNRSKISNRPLGIKYTSRVLDEYISMENLPSGQFSDWKRYGDFCTCNQMAIRFQKLDIENVMAYKSQYAGEYVNGCRRK